MTWIVVSNTRRSRKTIPHDNSLPKCVPWRIPSMSRDIYSLKTTFIFIYLMHVSLVIRSYPGNQNFDCNP